MSKLIDLTGQRFGRLVVIEPCGRSKDRHIMWLCRCDCGNEVVVTASNLKKSNTKSCGCLRRERIKESHQTHGKTTTRLYGIWCDIKTRCLNPKNRAFSWYGDRGISVCDEWKEDFQSFYDWAMENGYEDDMSIDRINVNGNYCPENCRWVSMKTQANNRRSNHQLSLNGETRTITEWSEITGIKRHTILQRLKRGWSVEEALKNK